MAVLNSLEALWDLRAVISDTTDVEFVVQADGSVLAFGLTEKGREIVKVYGSSYKTHESAMARARLMYSTWLCRCLIAPVPTSEEHLARFRAEMESRFGDPRLVIVKGQTYWIDEEPQDVAKALREASRGGPMLGQSGREFRILFRDGREVVSHNLWVGLAVPHELAGEYEDNAELGGARG